VLHRTLGVVAHPCLDFWLDDALFGADSYGHAYPCSDSASHNVSVGTTATAAAATPTVTPTTATTPQAGTAAAAAHTAAAAATIGCSATSCNLTAI